MVIVFVLGGTFFWGQKAPAGMSTRRPGFLKYPGYQQSLKRTRKTKVLQIGWPGGQNVTTPHGMFFNIWGGSQLPYIAKHENTFIGIY